MHADPALQLQPVVKQRHEPALALHLGQQGAGAGLFTMGAPLRQSLPQGLLAAHTRRSKGVP